MEPSRLFLFDLDGTLTLPRKPIMEDMVVALKSAMGKVKVGVVSGSDYGKICEQLQNNGEFKAERLLPQQEVGRGRRHLGL